MVKILSLILIPFTFSLSYAQSGTITDSLPPCINTVSFGDHMSFTEYEYKGQRWFSFTTNKSPIDENVSDKMTTIRFYDSDCHAKATWMKGGVAGLNKVFPDTIDKEKIITLRVILLDTSNGMKPLNFSLLPDTIYKLGLHKNSFWIEETAHQQGSLFRLQNVPGKNSGSKITFAGPYYDKKGNVAAPGPLTGKTFWWHYYGDRFYKTQFRPGYRQIN